MSKHPESDKRRSPRKEEGDKGRQEKFAEDLVYTINHAIVCGTTDIIDPFIGSWTQQYLGRRLVLNPLHDLGHSLEHGDHHDHHGHDHHDHHGHDHHDHDHHDHSHDADFWKNLKHWVIGEAVGDIGAVPVTLAMQYYTPGVMKGIQNTTEPLLGPAFKWAANRYSQKWAHENGFTKDSEEAKARADEIYIHEVEHLPHAFVWTGSAAGLNILTQKLIGNKGHISHLAAGKALGSAGTLITVLGLRSLFPNKVQKLDEWNSEKIAQPLTRKVSGWLGIDQETVERVLEQEREVDDGHRLSSHRPDDDNHKDNMPQKHIDSSEASLYSPVRITKLIG